MAGADDAKALRPILKFRSAKIAAAFKTGYIMIDYIGGASGLSQKASFYTSSACQVQCFIDNDAEGKRAIEKACAAKIIKIADLNLCTVPHLPESELEDIYDKDVYREAFNLKFRVDPKSRLSGEPRYKWTAFMERLFRESGKPWNDEIKFEIKHWPAEYGSMNYEKIIKTELEGPLSNFISSVESKIKV